MASAASRAGRAGKSAPTVVPVGATELERRADELVSSGATKRPLVGSDFDPPILLTTSERRFRPTFFRIDAEISQARNSPHEADHQRLAPAVRLPRDADHPQRDPAHARSLRHALEGFRSMAGSSAEGRRRPPAIDGLSTAPFPKFVPRSCLEPSGNFLGSLPEGLPASVRPGIAGIFHRGS
jgi:hypothetical protein